VTVSAYVGQLEEEISRRGEELERASLHLEKLEGVRAAQEAAICTLEARIRELEARLTEEEGACVPDRSDGLPLPAGSSCARGARVSSRPWRRPPGTLPGPLLEGAGAHADPGGRQGIV